MITLASGVSVAFVRAGRGPTVILIHGAMGDYRSWAPQWDQFITQFDCITYSRRYSYPNPNPMETRQHNALVDAEDLLGLMDACDVQTAVLVGSSYGGFTALAAALRAPDRVQAVVAAEAPMMRYALASPTGREIAQAFLETSAHPAREAFEKGEDEVGLRILTGGIIGRAPDDVPEHILSRRMPNLSAARSLALSDDEFPMLSKDALAALPMPVLLLSGKQTAPVHAAIFAEVCQAMPRARARLVEGSGHSVSQQAPEAFNDLVTEFLRDHGILTDSPV